MEKLVEDNGWKARVVQEHKEIAERIRKLDAWLNKQLETTHPEEIPGYRLMRMQLYVMQAYVLALEERMDKYGIEYRETST